MFSLFKKDNSAEFAVSDKVWKTSIAAQKGMLMMAMMRQQQNKSALIVAFFEDEMNQLSKFMHSNQIDYKIVDTSTSSTDFNLAQIYLLNESQLGSPTVTSILGSNIDKLGKSILFPSHYPIIDYENKVLSRLTSIGFEAFIFCLSFDDPMMGIFNMQNILPLLERLGLEEHEAVEHTMVSKSIQNARKKINEKAKGDIKGKSAKEWFALNIKN